MGRNDLENLLRRIDEAASPREGVSAALDFWARLAAGGKAPAGSFPGGAPAPEPLRRLRADLRRSLDERFRRPPLPLDLCDHLVALVSRLEREAGLLLLRGPAGPPSGPLARETVASALLQGEPAPEPARPPEEPAEWRRRGLDAGEVLVGRAGAAALERRLAMARLVFGARLPPLEVLAGSEELAARLHSLAPAAHDEGLIGLENAAEGHEPAGEGRDLLLAAVRRLADGSSRESLETWLQDRDRLRLLALEQEGAVARRWLAGVVSGEPPRTLADALRLTAAGPGGGPPGGAAREAADLAGLLEQDNLLAFREALAATGSAPLRAAGEALLGGGEVRHLPALLDWQLARRREALRLQGRLLRLGLACFRAGAPAELVDGLTRALTPGGPARPPEEEPPRGTEREDPGPLLRLIDLQAARTELSTLAGSLAAAGLLPPDGAALCARLVEETGALLRGGAGAGAPVQGGAGGRRASAVGPLAASLAAVRGAALREEGELEEALRAYDLGSEGPLRALEEAAAPPAPAGAADPGALRRYLAGLAALHLEEQRAARERRDAAREAVRALAARTLGGGPPCAAGGEGGAPPASAPPDGGGRPALEAAVELLTGRPRLLGLLEGIEPPEAAAALRDALLRLEDLPRLAPADLRRVALGAPRADLLAVLDGADGGLVRAVLRSLETGEAIALREELLDYGPIRLDEARAARERLLRLALALAAEGRIALPAREG